MNIMGYDISIQYPQWPVEKQTVINTINPHSNCVAKKDEVFSSALQQAEILIPDGIGIIFAAKFLYGVKIPRIAGADMHHYLLEIAQANKLKVFYLGASRETLQKITDRIHKEYPQIQANTYSPPYKSEFSDGDNRQMIEAVKRFSPSILFIGMTAPKQEKWVYQHKQQLNVQVICSIGAVFDFYAGTKKRAPKWMQKAGLEWMFRSFNEPFRMWRRNFISTPCFVLDVLKFKFKAGLYYSKKINGR
jgi:N-acetylglucosaminyldiphosphoundecaprenol N-acetyl-beta-D-mannosaminyltransferase